MRRTLRAVALTAAVGLLATTFASSAIAAGPSAAPAAGTAGLWAGPKLTTTPMSAAHAAAIDKLAQGALAQTPDLPGLWIGVWDPARGFYTQAYGEAVKGGAKATVADHGRIGSVTKTFTTAAVLEQVAAGKLKLESTVKDVLHELATKYPAIAGITVDQLAGMRSGIRDYANTGVVIKGVVADPTKVWTADDGGNGWIGHTGQLIGRESVVAYDTKTGAAFVSIVNDTASVLTAQSVGLQVFPDLMGLVGIGQ